MWPLLGLLLVPAVFGLENELRVKDFILGMDECHTLRTIRPTDNSSSDLDLSNLSLECLDKSVFSNVKNIRTISLANNSLYGVPAFVFANLTSLERLTLAGNKMTRFEKTFEGLKSLKTLDISNLPMEGLFQGYLHGLSSSTDVLMRNNKISTIATNIFEKGPNLDPEPEETRSKRSTKCGDVVKDVKDSKSNDTEVIRSAYHEKEPHRVKVCMDKSVVKVVELLKPDETLADGCREIRMHYFYPSLNLTKMGITSFQRNWYRIDPTLPVKVDAVMLDDNDISRVTSELLNDLPASVRLVSLVGNRIERLEAGVMVNDHLGILRLSKNSIATIEDGAFAKTKLYNLDLTDNRLKDTGFAASLPWTLYRLRLERNGIQRLNPGSFASLNTTTELFLAGNNITSLQRDSLQGLVSLLTLDLTSNGLENIEPGSFRHLRSIRTLRLPKNHISKLQSGVFEGVGTECILNLASNRFTKVTRDTLPDLPAKLSQLYLDNNMIESLDPGAFVKLPTYNLALNGNRISRIARGSFDLPQLEILTLSGNELAELDGESFEGLKGLHALTISNNGISRINKGSMRHLGGVRFLDISDNPIKRLNNGDLFGLKKTPSTLITLSEGTLELLQGGVFDDA